MMTCKKSALWTLGAKYSRKREQQMQRMEGSTSITEEQKTGQVAEEE